MSKNTKLIFYNIFFLILFIFVLEIIFGHWLKKDSFGVHMRAERNKNWKTTSTFNDKEYTFFYKRNYYGFRGNEFDPREVKIIFNGGSTSNQRYTPEELTIVGLLNSRLSKDNINKKIYNAATNGKSLRGIIYDFKFWFNKINNLSPKIIILYLGINEQALASNQAQKNYDIRMKNKKIDQVKDFIKNNSFIYEKCIKIKNKYFPKNTSGYFFEDNDLYHNFKYVNHSLAKNEFNKPSDKDLKVISQLNKRFEFLAEIFKEKNIIPIIITQVEFNGLNNETLFFINESIKNLAAKNNFYIIKLDELAIMKKNDFYDEVHTTPEGSVRIANFIYPKLKEIFEKIR